MTASKRSKTNPHAGLVYDSGALIADRGERRIWALHNRALQRGVRPIVPAGCVVEVWRERQPNLARLLEGCEIEELGTVAAKRSGQLRKGVSTAVGPIDATVAESAVRRLCAVVTSDRSDIEQLLSAARQRRSIIDI